MSLVTHDDQEMKILKFVQNKEKVSIYTLIESFSKKGIEPENIVGLVYYLAGRQLLSLEIQITEEGTETVASPTRLTAIHIRRKKG